MHISKHALKGLPKIQDENTQVYMDYVQDVLGNEKPRNELVKEYFPELYKDAVDRASGNARVIGANVRKVANSIERRKDVKAMFEHANKHAWIAFTQKKNKLYENLYSMALDDGIIPRDRIAASKVMLEHMPTFQEDINIKVEVKQSKEDFVLQLKEMQKSLQAQSLATVEPDVIEVEIV